MNNNDTVVSAIQTNTRQPEPTSKWLVVCFVGGGFIGLRCDNSGAKSHPEKSGMLGNANGIDLNNSELYELEKVGGLGRVLATRIIKHRPLRRWDDLRDIPGFDLELIKDLRGSGAKLGRVNPLTAQKRAARVLSISTGRRKPINRKNAKPRGRTRTARNIFSGRGMSPD